ncbi:MAG TPA: tripartite tricarboxylate transporter substrate-binding protein, partial [Myxococcaceae bacterium]|nr:tripartite tricarboxylate transporter substrate-binding protein [Myxococcaceae bacterium]
MEAVDALATLTRAAQAEGSRALGRSSMMRTICFLACMFSLSAAAQESYPDKPIRIVVGYSAGGGNDVIVRAMTTELSRGLGQPVIVENKPGAQSIIAAGMVAKSPPDGYTILMGPSGPMTINPAIYSKLPYDPRRDFAPVSMICQFPLILAVNPSLPIRNVKELIEYGKANPQKANYASSAGIFQLATELFKQKTGTNFVMIPYKGSGESVQAVMS